MDGFERRLAQATSDTATGLRTGLVGAIAIVVDDQGRTLYWHAAGRQSLTADAPPLDRDSTVSLGSAGKVVTHIAALQLVEQGRVALDEPVDKHLPELGACKVATANGSDADGSDDGSAGYRLREPASPITLRHLLLHASGLSEHDTVDRRFGTGTAAKAAKDSVDTANADAHPIAQRFSIPLLFDPGQGHAYGYSIHWTQLLVARASGAPSFAQYVQQHIFGPLGMATSSYTPWQADAAVWQRRLHMVERGEKDGGAALLDAEDAQQGLMCSVSDVGRLLSALLASSPVLLRDAAHYDLLWTAQFAADGAALRDVRADMDNYGFVTGRANGATLLSQPAVNWSAGGLVVEGSEELPVSGLPPGTVTWEGMPNVLWAMNRERKRAAFFATQLIPVGDPEANGLALVFMKDAWRAF
ncbi:hypothetical protein SCUCBS95973_002875 [Sporothrix curviconia]|uniref:Beta-lactamase-related domain-containing protein n=1 Tax=Sporothrix curviconia TaxID=1260050 RepID=A0ABP0BAN7_9PEZI